MINKPILKHILNSLRFFLLTWMLIYISPQGLFAQIKDIQFKHLTIDNGLSHSWIYSIIQDRFGFIWIGTDDGLNRYDGNTFRIYKNIFKNVNSISSNSNKCVFEDSKGNLWIGTGQGLNLYDRKNDRFLKNPRWPLIEVRTITEDENNTLWIGTAIDLYNLDLKNDSVRIYHSNYISHNANISTSGGINQVYIDRKNNVWIGSGYGLHLYNREKDFFVNYFYDYKDPNSLCDNNVHSILEDKAGRLWIGTQAGLDLFANYYDHPQKASFVHHKNNVEDQNSISQGSVLSLLEDGKNNLWVGIENGGLDLLELNTYKKGVDNFIHFANDPNKPASLSNNSIYSLFQDIQGNVWIGTYGNGINIISAIRDKFIHVMSEPSQKNSLINKQVNTFLDEGNILWIGTEGGLDRYDKKNNKFKHFVHNPLDKNSIGSNAVWALCRDKRGNLWVGTWGGGLNRFNYTSETFEHYYNNPLDTTSIGSNNIISFLEDSKGYLWICTMGGGLNMFDRNKKIFIRYNKTNSYINTDYVQSIVETENGDLWLSNTLSIERFDRKTKIFEHFVHDESDSNSLSSNKVMSVFKDSKGNIWACTDAGLNLYIKKINGFKHYKIEDGLPNNFINSILEDNQGNIWLGTNRGLSKFINAINIPASPKFRNYVYEDGLQSIGFNKRSCLLGTDGMIYFGGVNGFNVFDPNKLSENTYIPPIVITDFQVFNKSISLGDKGYDNTIGKAEDLVLSYTQSVFSFDFAALNYISSSKNQYAYKMEGFDDDWNYVGKKHAATYTNLDPGKYIFRVKGSNNDGVWNEKGISLPIIITPPFRATIWFRLILAVVAAGIVYWIYQWRMQSRDLTAQKRMEAALKKERNLLRTLIDNLPFGIYIKDKECRKIVVNPVDVHHLGRTLEAEVLGKNDFDMYPREIAEGFYADDQKVIQTDKPVIDREEYVFDENGKKICLLTTKLPLHDENNHIIGLIGIGRNITDRKLAEETLSQKTALLEAQLNSSIDGVMVVDNQGKKILQNQRTVELWKIPKEIADNPDDQMQVAHVMHATKDPDQFVSQVKYLYSHPDETSRDEIELKDGTVLDRYSAPVVGSDGRNYGRIWSFHDITERKHAEKEREKLIRELQDALADVKLLSGLVPICANCKKIRDDQGYWTQIESYIQDRSDAKFSHSICPDCAAKLYPNYNIKK